MMDLPQKYGTQFRIQSDGTKELLPLEDPKKVNIWRNEIGLSEIEIGN